MTRYRTLIVAPLFAAAALAFAATAQANTFCVNAPDCPAGGVSTGGDLQAAFDDAAAHGGADTVLVGGKGTPYRGPFTYLPNTRVIDPVTIAADGGRPVLTAGVGDTVLTMVGGTLDGVDVLMPSAADGVGVDMRDSTLHDVTVSSSAGGPGAIGIVESGQAVLDHVRVTATGDVGLSVQGGQIAGTEAAASAQNLQISGSLVGVDVNAAGRFSATQSQLSGSSLGIKSNGVTNLDRVTVATSAASSTGIIQSEGSLALEHVTVAHEGPKSGSDTALLLQAANANRSATIADSALAGYTHGIERTVGAGFALALTIQNTVWDPAGDQLGPASAGTVHEVGDVHVEPTLVNLAGGDLRPRGSSAQIDLDTITDPAAYTDLNGTPTVDGNGDGVARPDAGALEYRHLAPTIDMVAAPAGGVAGTALAFSAGVSDADGDHVQARWDFGDGNSATTSSATHAYVSPGTYQGAITATDEAGLTDRRTFTVTVGPAASTGGNPGGSTGAKPPPRRLTLVLRDLRLSSSRISVKHAGRLRLRLSANESATIRIAAARSIGPRTTGARSIVRHVKAGSGSIALAASLRKLRLLRPGRLTLTVNAVDVTGSRTRARTLRLTLLR